MRVFVFVCVCVCVCSSTWYCGCVANKKNITTQNKHGNKRKQYLHMSVFVLLDVFITAKTNNSSDCFSLI